ncbi:restriction endonuclease subunit S [Vibrio breoganii]
MTGRYKAYLEYKDSNQTWIGAVPSHWNVLSAKRVFSSVRVPAKKSDEQLAASQKYGVIPQSLMMKLNSSKVMLALKGTESFRHVDKDNFVISLRSFEGGIEHSAYEGCVSPAYTVLKASKKMHCSYYKYLLKCAPFIAALQSSTDSLRDGKSISFEQFGAISLPYCQYEEQQKIARFLDHETAKIDTLITKQEKLIELLKEKRQAVISHAVTKGLNPDAPMKDSGVEWLGEVPEHWVVKKLSSCSKITRLAGYEYTAYWKATESGEIIAIRGQNIRFNKLIEMDKTERISTSLSERLSRSKLYCGDIAYPCVGTIGYAVLIEENDKYHINQNIAKLTPTDRVAPLYLTYFLNSKICLESALFLNTSDAQPSILVGNLRKVKIAIPNLEEQNRISQFLQLKLKKLDEINDKALITIDLMKERKTALISAAVTGKIDVRDWQSRGVQG